MQKYVAEFSVFSQESFTGKKVELYQMAQGDPKLMHAVEMFGDMQVVESIADKGDQIKAGMYFYGEPNSSTVYPIGEGQDALEQFLVNYTAEMDEEEDQ